MRDAGKNHDVAAPGERSPREVRESGGKTLRVTLKRNESLDFRPYLESPLRPLEHVYVNREYQAPPVKAALAGDQVTLKSKWAFETAGEYRYDVYFYTTGAEVYRSRLIVHVERDARQVPAVRPRPSATPKRILVITVDDMLNVYNRRYQYNLPFQTPQTDRLRKRATLFSAASASTPICRASRASMWSGMSTLRHRVSIGNERWQDAYAPETTTPGRLKAAGFRVGLFGKVFHEASMDGGLLKAAEYDRMATDWAQPLGLRGADRAPHAEKLGSYPFVRHHGPEDELVDWNVAEQAISFLTDGVGRDEDFFLAVGFYKPHLAWGVPPRFFERVALEDIRVPAFDEDDLGDVPMWARLHMGQFLDAHDKIGTEAQWRRAIQAYMAALSYVDAQVGRVLRVLETSGLSEGCTIILASDHGYHLGEKDRWRKNTLWESSVNAPLLISLPPEDVAGERRPQTCTRPVSLADLHDTILDLADVPAATVEASDGRSLVRLARRADAELADRQTVLTVVNASHSLRSQRMRYSRYQDGSEELYHVERDPYSSQNLATDSNWASELNWHRRRMDLHLKSETGSASAQQTTVPPISDNKSQVDNSD